MRPRERNLHDLHRIATHVNIPMQETPMTRHLKRIMMMRFRNNSFKRRPVTRSGIMITGGGYQGKTESACEIAAQFEEEWLTITRRLNPQALPGTRDIHVPVSYVQTPVTAKPIATCRAILDFFGADYHKMGLTELTKAVRTSLNDHGVRVLILDDITRLKMHRADDQDTLDMLRAFMSMNTTLVLIGVNIPGSGLLREGTPDPRTDQIVFRVENDEDPATQTERRFDLLHLRPFSYDTDRDIKAWETYLASLETHLRLFNAPRKGMLTGGTMPEYLFRRTNGVAGLLERLIEDGCAEAMNTEAEVLTEELLDDIGINLGNDPRRDAAAGEVPAVPAKTPAASKKPSHRGRNKVFDDHGIPLGESISA
ncbi:TniB family NTP-binding protein [Actinoplanes sp. NPDC024001]|uniref:TniB family NTP-binding protein n=1 Tax=unclassified Actinoplanes TaxID=2626549 RepID=UPI002E244D27